MIPELNESGGILKENLRQKHIYLVLLYGACYLAGFRILESNVTKGYHEIHMAIDDRIPFCELFIIPYLLWFAYVAVTVFYFMFCQKELQEYFQLVISLAIGMTVFLVISWIYPNGQNLRPVVFPRNNIFTDLVRYVYRLDTPTNIFPSVHVYNSVACCIALFRCKALKDKKWLLQGTLVLTILIILSTMFLKQHSVFDVISALTLNAIVFLTLYQPGEQIHPSEKKVTKKVFEN